jgi:hypothetical protein
MSDQLIGLLIVVAAKCAAGCGAISRKVLRKVLGELRAGV